MTEQGESGPPSTTVSSTTPALATSTASQPVVVPSPAQNFPLAASPFQIRGGPEAATSGTASPAGQHQPRSGQGSAGMLIAPYPGLMLAGGELYEAGVHCFLGLRG